MTAIGRKQEIDAGLSRMPALADVARSFHDGLGSVWAALFLSPARTGRTPKRRIALSLDQVVALNDRRLGRRVAGLVRRPAHIRRRGLLRRSRSGTAGSARPRRSPVPCRATMRLPSAFKIANNGAVSMIAPPGPVINADDARWYRRRTVVSANGSQQRIIAHREPETIFKSGRRPTTQCESKIANQTVQACCPASHRANYVVTKALGENLSAAITSTTDEASDGQVQLDPPMRVSLR